jgi:hypothetical protein
MTVLVFLRGASGVTARVFLVGVFGVMFCFMTMIE